MNSRDGFTLAGLAPENSPYALSTLHSPLIDSRLGSAADLAVKDKPANQSWVVVASANHVEAAVRGQFIQAGHGKRSAVAHFARGDTIVCYSSKQRYGENALCQSFTALGTVLDDEPFQFCFHEAAVAANPEAMFSPYRRRMRWRAEARSVPIQPLIAMLSFIQNKKSWGFMFRFGVFRIPPADAQLIGAAMTSSLPD
jgi:hypothetical protein